MFIMGSSVAAETVADVERIGEALRGQTFGSTRVVAVDLTISEDANGDRALFVAATLADPTDDTWPYDDILMLRRRVLEVAREIPPIEIPIYVTVSPETDSPQGDDEARLFPDA